jgi:hypothetical protein
MAKESPMYNHPILVEGAARHHQNELLREARSAHLARLAYDGRSNGNDRHGPVHHQLVAAAVAMLMLVGLAGLI